ncbi:MAG: ABC transporter permease subunit [Egibacteraceae bacterium]
MTKTLQTEQAQPVADPAPDPPRRAYRGALRLVLATAGAFLVFAVFLLARGADPLAVFASMARSAAGNPRAIGETLIRTAPLLLAALAVAVPARAGLFNIGGEGQILMGAVGAAAAARLLSAATPRGLALLAMIAAGAAAGAALALAAGLLKVVARTNEAITTLLLNYVAILILTWLVFGPWKDPTSLGQAYSTPLDPGMRLPILWGSRVHAGILLALAAAPLVWAAMRFTRWGFTLRVLGGNPNAARRAGFAVGALTLSAMAAGGALAGVAGMLEVAGVEGRLRPGMMAGFGFIGFLASWLARHHPLRIVGAALLLAAVAVGGNGLKITAGLSGAAVNVLMALLLLGILGWGRTAAGRQ